MGKAFGQVSSVNRAPWAACPFMHEPEADSTKNSFEWLKAQSLLKGTNAAEVLSSESQYDSYRYDELPMSLFAKQLHSGTLVHYDEPGLA